MTRQGRSTKSGDHPAGEKRRFAAAVALVFLLTLVPAASTAVSGSDTITTVAGSFTPGLSGDGNLAILAQLKAPRGIALDAAGNLYIADQGNHRIRKVDSAGVISTVAGTGNEDFDGDGEAATDADLDDPTGVAVDASGNIFIADRDNNRIRKVDPAGLISTFAGTGTAGFSGDGGLATKAQLNSPRGVAVDALGNVYIADTRNNRIRKVQTNGVILTVAGDGSDGSHGVGGPATSAGVSFPTGVAVDGEGSFYIAENRNHRVSTVDPAGTITTVAGTGDDDFSGDGGQATLADLNDPSDVAVDAAGNVYIADTNNSRIRKVDLAGVISTVAGTGAVGFSGDGGPAARAVLAFPRGVALGSTGNLYVADTDNHKIRQIANPPPTASFTAVPRTGFAPLAVSFDASGSIDPNTSIAEYAWDFGDGASGSGPVTSHTYTAPGTYTATLSVSDEGGATAALTTSISVKRTASCNGVRATIVGTPRRDNITGTPGRDVIVALGGADVIRGRGGNDLICGGAGADSIFAGGGKDTVFGQGGSDTIRGGRGGDSLRGQAGRDRLLGQGGPDRLLGGGGRDRLIGGGGRDIADGGAGNDLCQTEVQKRC